MSLLLTFVSQETAMDESLIVDMAILGREQRGDTCFYEVEVHYNHTLISTIRKQ